MPRRVGGEFVQRVLAPREQLRIGALLALAATAVRERLDAGEQRRQDDFFAAGGKRRSTAEEITEGVLLVAQREHEESKIPLLAAIPFHPEVDRRYANLLVRLGEDLSYAQRGPRPVPAAPARAPGRRSCAVRCHAFGTCPRVPPRRPKEPTQRSSP